MVYEPEHLVYLGSDPVTAALLRAAVYGGDTTGAPHNGNLAPATGAFVAVLTNQKTALRYVAEHPTATVIVETGPKPESRLRFCQMLRARVPTAPIVAVISAVGAGRTAGAQTGPFKFDAVLSPPLDPETVRRSLQRLRTDAAGPIRRSGGIELDIATRRLTSERGEHELTPKQSALLQLLMEHAGTVVPRADIMRTVWETTYLQDTRTLDVHIRWLRTFIEPDPADPVYLVTVRGVGYKFVARDEGLGIRAATADP